MLKKLVITLVIIAVLIGGYSFYNNKLGTRAVNTEARSVKTKVVVPDSITTTVMADGRVVVAEEVEIKAPVDGIIEDLYIETGSYLKSKDRILKFDDEALVNDLGDARLEQEEAEKNYQELLNTYNNQDELYQLQIKDAEQNLELVNLSLKKEEIELANTRTDLVNQIDSLERELDKALQELEKKRYLYEREVIPEVELETAEDYYQAKKSQYENLNQSLKRFEEVTVPNSLQLAEVKVENARNQLEVLKATIKKERITENNLELARIKVKKTENKVRDIKKELEKLTVYSTRTGTIINLPIKAGEKLTTGQTLCTIADISNLIIEAMVDEIDINEVSTGQKVNVSSDSFRGILEGRVNFIAPTAVKEGNINKFKTEIFVKDLQNILKPGMFVNTEITTNHREDIFTLPPLAIQGENEKYVYIMNEGLAEKRKVETGLENLTEVEVVGVENGEKIIIGPFTTLQELKPGESVVEVDSGDQS